MQDQTPNTATMTAQPTEPLPVLLREGKDSSPEETTSADSTPEGSITCSPTPSSQIALLMLALCLSVFLAALDAVLIATALPSIARAVSASDAGFAWIGAAYLLAMAAAVPLWGRASDILGRKPLIMTAQAFFMAGSLVSALAPDLAVLVAGRAVQGLGAGGVMALVNIVVGDMFSPRERGAYFGMIGAAWGLASGVGPLLGGGLTEGLSWRWCFWINLPVSAISLIILAVYMRKPVMAARDIRGRKKRSVVADLLAIDWLGAATFAAATLLLLVGLELGGTQRPWTSPLVLCLVFSGATMYGLFALTQARVSRHPLMPPLLFRDTAIVATYVATFFHGLTFASLAFFLPVYFQAVLGASPIHSGVWLLATAVPLALCTMCVGVLIRRTGRYIDIIRAAAAVTVLAMGLFVTFPPEPDWARIITFQIVAALGVAPNLQALLIGLQARVSKEDLAAGTAAFAFVRNVSVGIGVVIGQVMLQSAMGMRRGEMVEAGVDAALAERLSGGGAIATMGGGMTELGLGGLQADLVRRCLTDGLGRLWVMQCVTAAAGLVSTIFIRQVDLDGRGEEAKGESHGGTRREDQSV
ncbi:major facilitator superfamily domain-containing protein [Plectosphaerella plurivora]|uniref:Major facilitator superfamily domain-containing protein n=1 Tax=Plectosphaerella plurivora TaxID=936078 RepID=A0A9P9AFD0_9PEZI|nr:major facilitator superfamily domain-containing protein [Plectosphaerella plurivora]